MTYSQGTAIVDYEAMPKVELHCHLDGIVDPAMLRELHTTGYELPVSEDDLARILPVSSLEGFFGWFDASKPLTGHLDYLKLVMALQMERLQAQHVMYAEIMISGGDLPRDPAAAIDAVAAFREWVAEREAGTLQIEFLVAFGKQRTTEHFAANAERNIRLYEAGLIVGTGLAGPERGYPVEPFTQSLARLRDTGMGIEIHAGEWAGPESVWDALQHGSPHRIGHGTHLFADERLVDYVKEHGIHIEMCPTSNLKTGSIQRIEEHPIGRARDLGLSFSVNTDDPGPFECSMSSEYALLGSVFGFSERDFAQLYSDSLAARFQPHLRIPVSEPGVATD